MKKLMSILLCIFVFCTTIVLPAYATGDETTFVEGETILAFENFDDVSEWTIAEDGLSATKAAKKGTLSLASTSVLSVNNGKLTLKGTYGTTVRIGYSLGEKKTSGRYVMEYSQSADSRENWRPYFYINSNRPANYHNMKQPAGDYILTINDTETSLYTDGLATTENTVATAISSSTGVTGAAVEIYNYAHNCVFDHFAVIDASGNLNYEISDITKIGAVIKTNMPIFLDAEKSSVTVDGVAATITKKANTTCEYDVAFASALDDGSHTISASLTNVFDDAAVVKEKSVTFETPFVEGETILAFENFDDVSEWTIAEDGLTASKAAKQGTLSLTSTSVLSVNGGKLTLKGTYGTTVRVGYSLGEKKTSGRYVMEYKNESGRDTWKPYFLINSGRPASYHNMSSHPAGDYILTIDDTGTNLYTNGLATTENNVATAISSSAGVTGAAVEIYNYAHDCVFDHFAVIDASGNLNFEISDITKTGAVIKTNMPIFLDAEKSSVTVDGVEAVITKKANTTCEYDVAFANTLSGGDHTIKASLTNVFGDTAVVKERSASFAINEWTEPDYIYNTSFDTDPVSGNELNASVYINSLGASTLDGEFGYSVANSRIALRNIASNNQGGFVWLTKSFAQPLSNNKIIVEFDGNAARYGKTYPVVNFKDKWNVTSFSGVTQDFSGRTTAVIDKTAGKVYVYENDVLKQTYDFTGDINNIGFASENSYKKQSIFDKFSIVGADNKFAVKFDNVTSTGAVLKTNVPMFVSEAVIKIDENAATVEKIDGVTNEYKVTWAQKLTVGEEKTAVLNVKSYTGDAYENLEIKINPSVDDEISFATTLPVENGNGICGFDSMTAAEVLNTVTIPESASMKMYTAAGAEVSGSEAAMEGMYVRVTFGNGETADYKLAFAGIRLDDVYYTMDETKASVYVNGKAYKAMPAYDLIVAQYDGDELIGANVGTFTNNDDGTFSGVAEVNLQTAQNSIVKGFIWDGENIRPLQKNKKWNNELDGVKIITMGDSITGMDDDTYPSFLASMGADVTNVGVSSTNMAWDTNVSASSVADVLAGNKESSDISQNFAGDGTTINDQRLAAMDAADITQTDVVTILYGTNDWNGNVAISNPNNTKDVSTVAGALRYTIETLSAANPNLKIVAIAPVYRNKQGSTDACSDVTVNKMGYKLSDYNSAISEVAAEYDNVYFFDAYAESGINRYNADVYLSDGLHPAKAGAGMLANAIYEFIRDNVIAD